MKKTITLAAAALLCVSLVSLAGDSKKPGEKSASGTISKLDVEAKTLTIAAPDGKTWSISWNDSTRILGGELKEGEPVKVGYVESDARMWASWIRVGPAKS